MPSLEESKLGENFRYEIKPEIDFILNEIIKDLPFLKKGQMREIKDKYHDYANLAKKIQKESEDAVLNFVFDTCCDVSVIAITSISDEVLIKKLWNW